MPNLSDTNNIFTSVYHRAAQRELYSLARIAEIKSQKTKKATGEVDLDAMFEFLSAKPQPHGADEMAFVSQIQNELDAMFRESQPKAEGSRTMRRRRRVQKKLLGLHEEDDKKEEPFNIQEYSMVAYAEKWFNDHPKDSGGLGTLTLRRRTKSGLKGVWKDYIVYDLVVKFMVNY